MTVYAVLNRKGGVGKTTTAVTVAHGLSLKLRANGGGNVLLVDLDPQGHVGAALGIKAGEHDIADVLLGNAHVADAIVPAGGARPGLYVLLASDRLAAAKRALKDLEAVAKRASSESGISVPFAETSTLLSDRIGQVVSRFEFIILDCPPSLDDLADAVYDFADYAIVPVKPDYLGATGTRQHTQDIVQARERGFKITIEVIVPTFFRKREVLARQVVIDLARTYGRNRLSRPVPQSVVLEQAPADHQQTIFEYAPKHEAALAYAALVNRIYRKGK